MFCLFPPHYRSSPCHHRPPPSFSIVFLLCPFFFPFYPLRSIFLHPHNYLSIIFFSSLLFSYLSHFTSLLPFLPFSLTRYFLLPLTLFPVFYPFLLPLPATLSLTTTPLYFNSWSVHQFVFPHPYCLSFRCSSGSGRGRIGPAALTIQTPAVTICFNTNRDKLSLPSYLFHYQILLSGAQSKSYSIALNSLFLCSIILFNYCFGDNLLRA